MRVLTDSGLRESTDEPMTPKEPHIAETGHGRVLVGQGRDLVLALRRGAWGSLLGVVQENVDFGWGEAAGLEKLTQLVAPTCVSRLTRETPVRAL